MRPTLTLTGLTLTFMLSLTIGGTSGASGPISDTPFMFPRFSENFDASPFEMEDTREGPSARFRLPNQITPKHYNLHIRPILQGDPEVNPFIAPGTVQITVQCQQPTNNLVMHAAELNITLSSVRVWSTREPAVQLTILNQTFDTDAMVQSYTITTQETLVPGELYEIYIEYVAKVANPHTERMNGVYWSSYQSDSGERRYLATTQFSRTRAFRKTLPSFDEPSQKATFEISVGREDAYHSLSNMNLLRSEPIPGLPGWTWDRYNTTPVMSPTIIAFIVSDFVNETADPNIFHPEKPVRIWGPPPEMLDGGGVFAADAAAKTLKYFEDYFGIEYELPKIDSAAIPDFAAGAMENWGLNTYRVMYLIWKEGINTVAEKFRIANIVGHELAHQYWGNLVTHAWWNDWWLTEGFASYYEYRSVDAFHPDFEAIDRLVTSDVQPAMAFDSGPASMPIHGENSTHFVENPSEINYAKGAALVNMMRSFMTEEVFKQACNYYLKNRAYSAVDQDALFTDLNTYLSMNGLMPSNNKTIKQIMDTWTLQTSFPLVKVSRAGANHIFISQERFENFGVERTQEPSELWNVPIFYTSAKQPVFDPDQNLPKFWIDSDVLLMMHAIDTSQWLLVNPGGNGYYRVIYDTHFENLLKTQLATNITTIPTGSRSMIVDDYFSAAYQSYIPITRALDMMGFMSTEMNFNVFVPFLKHLRKGYELFSNNATDFGKFKAHIEQVMQTALDRIGLEQIPGEPSMTTILRVQLFDWLCPMFHTGCVAEADRLFALWKAAPGVNPIPADLRPSLYCAATSEVANANWDFLMTQYDLTRDSLIRNGLACTPSAAQITTLLTKIMADNTMPASDVRGFLERLAANSIARPEVLTQLTSQFPSLILPTKLGDAGVAGVISSLATYTSDTDIRDQLQALVTAHEDELNNEEVMRTINGSLARITSNKQWFDNFGSTILQWLPTPSP